MCYISNKLVMHDQPAGIDQIKINLNPDINKNKININTYYLINFQKLSLKGTID